MSVSGIEINDNNETTQTYTFLYISVYFIILPSNMVGGANTL
jgi:hypothetical protein